MAPDWYQNVAIEEKLFLHISNINVYNNQMSHLPRKWQIMVVFVVTVVIVVITVTKFCNSFFQMRLFK